jgi:hypothetical protein
MSPTAQRTLEQALQLDENERRELVKDHTMSAFPIPAEVEAQVRAVAENTHQDAAAVWAQVLKQGLAGVLKQAFDRELLENYEAGERGEYITEEESIARIEAIERGE